MKPRSICLTDDQAAHFATEQPTEWLHVGAMEQPPRGYKFDCMVSPNFVEFVPKINVGDVFVRFTIPYSVGCEVKLKETWGRISRDCAGGFRTFYVYKTNYKGTLIIPKWRSPATQPADAVRWIGKVIGVRVCQVREMTPEEILLTGCGWGI